MDLCVIFEPGRPKWDHGLGGMVGCSVWDYEVHGQMPKGISDWSYALQSKWNLPDNSMDVTFRKGRV